MDAATLKLVQGAVAKKDYVPALTHFHIEDGRIYGFNGVMAISAPIDLAVTATPKAVPFVKAIESLPEGNAVVLNLTTAGKLSIKAGNFRAYVDCHDDSRGLVKVDPTGDNVPLPKGILPVLSKLAPFMGVDASRPWAMGIQLAGRSAYATNNIVLIEHWLPLHFPQPFVLPAEAIKEMIRIKKEPVSIQITTNAVAFHYDTGAWIRTQLIEGSWPDLSRILDKPAPAGPFPVGFFDGMKRLAPFVDEVGRLYLKDGCMATHMAEGEGAVIELPGFAGVGCHQLEQMAKLSGVATSIDFGAYPSVCLFFGDMLRGAIVGMRG
jgi:hypothetical protein